MTSDRVPVAIIGGGFSGTILAAQLARTGIASALIDGSGRAGVGTAYSTVEPAHLLNVRAEMMSAWADEPDHFARRFEAEGGDRRGFAQRRLFGRYLARHPRRGGAARKWSSAMRGGVHREDGGWAVELDDGRDGPAPRPSSSPTAINCPSRSAPAGSKLINDPWGADAQAAVRELADSDGDVLIVGTSLTMVDLALSLDAAGHRGRIVALSRRGLVPRAHADYRTGAGRGRRVPARRFAWIVGVAAGGARAEVGWRAAVDSLRPHSHALWQSFDQRQQRRFLRHARPWWDVLRHRIAPEVAATIVRMVEQGRLEIVAGRIVGMGATGDAHRVEYPPPRPAQTNRRASITSSTAPARWDAIERTRDPLLRGLLDDGLVRPDHLGIGVEVDERSRAPGSDCGPWGR